MSNTLKHGDEVIARYVFLHPTKQNEFTHRMEPAVVTGFADSRAPRLQIGDVLVRYADGSQAWLGRAAICAA